MLNLGLEKYLEKYKEIPRVIGKVPRHELSAMVDEILKVTGVEKDYPYGFWCRKVSFSKKCFFQILDICKIASELPDKYPKGAFIRNQLCNKKKKKNLEW